MKGFEYIWRYLRGERKGKAANRLEREALSDPFLYEALEGLEEVQADHEQVMKELRRGLQPGMGERRRWKAIRWLAAASILLVGGVALWLLAGQEDPESGQVAWMMQEVKTDSAVTESAVVAAVVSEADTIAVEEVKEEKGRRDSASGVRDRKIDGVFRKGQECRDGGGTGTCRKGGSRVAGGRFREGGEECKRNAGQASGTYEGTAGNVRNPFGRSDTGKLCHKAATAPEASGRMAGRWSNFLRYGQKAEPETEVGGFAGYGLE